MIASGMGEDRASWYDHKQRMTTAETWATRRKVGPDVAAEESRNVDQSVATEIEKDQRVIAFENQTLFPALEALPEETQPAA